MYYTLIIAIIYGAYIGFQEMGSCKKSNVPYHEPKNIFEFLINNRS